MGFSLEMFFKELQFILNNDKTPDQKLIKLREEIEDSYTYAQECGQVRGESNE